MIVTDGFTIPHNRTLMALDGYPIAAKAIESWKRLNGVGRTVWALGGMTTVQRSALGGMTTVQRPICAKQRTNG